MPLQFRAASDLFVVGMRPFSQCLTIAHWGTTGKKQLVSANPLVGLKSKCLEEAMLAVQVRSQVNRCRDQSFPKPLEAGRATTRFLHYYAMGRFRCRQP